MEIQPVRRVRTAPQRNPNIQADVKFGMTRKSPSFFASTLRPGFVSKIAAWATLALGTGSWLYQDRLQRETQASNQAVHEKVQYQRDVRLDRLLDTHAQTIQAQSERLTAQAHTQQAQSERLSAQDHTQQAQSEWLAVQDQTQQAQAHTIQELEQRLEQQTEKLTAQDQKLAKQAQALETSTQLIQRLRQENTERIELALKALRAEANQQQAADTHEKTANATSIKLLEAELKALQAGLKHSEQALQHRLAETTGKLEHMSTQVQKQANRITLDQMVEVVGNTAPATVKIISPSNQSGSGFILDRNDQVVRVLTNAHVAHEPNADAVYTLQLYTGDDIRPPVILKGKVITIGAGLRLDSAPFSASGHDWSIIEAEVPATAPLPAECRPLVLRNFQTDPLKIGEPVVIFGNPWEFVDRVASGVISKKDSHFAHWAPGNIVVEIDATINPGNSGGAIVDAQGRVIAITVGKSYTYEEVRPDGSVVIHSREGLACGVQINTIIQDLTKLRKIIGGDLFQVDKCPPAEPVSQPLVMHATAKPPAIAAAATPPNVKPTTTP